MTTGREAFLQRVREAVAAGNRAGASPEIPSRGSLGYQGAGPDPVARFLQELGVAGGRGQTVPDRVAAAAKVVELVRAANARKVLLGVGRFLDSLSLEEPLRALGVEVTRVDRLAPDTCRDPLFAADVGISEPDYLIAETGSLAVTARRDEPRSLSLLPPIHIAVAERSHLLPDLFDLFAAYEASPPANGAAARELPSCLALVTGPSKTGDIELRLVTGVHGPGELHVVLMTS